MANNLLTVSWITREALRIFRNSNWFLRTINREFDDEFGRVGRKIGATLRIRLPNDYIVRNGPTAVPQDTAEQQTTLVLANQMGVDMSFSSAERELSLDDFSRRIIAPAVNKLAGAVSVNVMGIINQSSNLVRNVNGGGATISPTAGTWLAAGAVLDQNGAPRNDRFIVMDPLTQARTVTSLMGLFNPQVKISGQYTRGTITTDTLGFDWGMDQTVQIHSTAAWTALPTVAGANQIGSSITTTAVGAGGLNAGDIISFDGVNSVNRVTNQTNGVPAQFTVTARVNPGATSIPIYPPLIPFWNGVNPPPANMPSGAQPGDPVPYQTVDVSPATGAAITVATASGEQYRANFAYYAEAVTMATAELELPRGVHEAYRETYDGISMRVISDYAVLSDQFITRLDILFGAACVRPEWVVKVADVITEGP